MQLGVSVRLNTIIYYIYKEERGGRRGRKKKQDIILIKDRITLELNDF